MLSQPGCCDAHFILKYQTMSKPNIIIKGGFRDRKMPLSADYRPLYKIGLVILTLKIASTGSRSSLNKLHFMMYALKSSWNRSFIRSAIEADDISPIISWGVEPALNKALMFAVAEGFIEIDGDRYALTSVGDTFAKMMIKDNGLFTEEKDFLTFIGKRKVTEAFMLNLTNKIGN